MDNYYIPNKKFSLPKIPSLKFKFPKINFGLIFKILGVLILLVIILAGVLWYIYGRPAYAIYVAAKELKDSSYGLQQSLKTQDLDKIEQNLTNFKGHYSDFKKVYNEKSGPLKSLPYVKDYVGDVDHFLAASDKGIDLGFLVLDTLKPYAADLGLKEGSKLTNEQKIEKLANVLPKLSNEVDKISGLMLDIDSELAQVDATKYPEEFRGVLIRDQIVSIKTVFSELAQKSPKFKGLFEQLPTLLGVLEPKKYLVLMANSTEIRMNGGFTTYAIVVEMDKGIPKVLKSVDTYFIDVDSYALVNQNIYPQYYFIGDYLRLNRIYARDALSLTPDFKDSSDYFINRYWNLHPGTGAAGLLPKVDGVIQVNTHLAIELLRVLGPVDVKGRSFLTDQGTYKGFGDTEFNSDNIIYNLEVIANSELSEIEGRKDIIRFLLESILNKVLNAKTENLIPLAQTFLEALGSKDIIINSFDLTVEQAMQDLGYAGRIRTVPNGSWDYLFVVHSNLGGGKRDWLVTRETTKEVYKKDGNSYSKVSIKVNNPKSPDWWEQPWLYTYKDFIRVYVPEGSKIVKATASDGSDINTKELTSDEYKKEMFDFYFWLEESKSMTLNIEYTLPDTVDLNDYKLLLQKQSGTHGDLYTIIHDNNEKKFTLNSDMEISL